MDVEDLGFSLGGGRYVATSAADRTAKLWDRETGEKIVEMPHNGAVLPLDFTHDGLKLMTGSVDKSPASGICAPDRQSTNGNTKVKSALWMSPPMAGTG